MPNPEKFNGTFKAVAATLVSLLLYGAGVLTAQGRSEEKLDRTVLTLTDHLKVDAVDHDSIIELRAELRNISKTQADILELLKKK